MAKAAAPPRAHMPAAPPPPAAAVARVAEPPRYKPTVCEIAELHELHAEMGRLTSPARESFVPLTVISGGFAAGARRQPLLFRPGKNQEVRGLFAGWLKGLTGDAGPWGGDGGRLSVELWAAECVGGFWRPLSTAASEGESSGGAAPQMISTDGVTDFVIGDNGWAVGVERHIISSAHEGVELFERLLGSSVSAPSSGAGRGHSSFVAVGVDLRRYVAELGCTFQISALWLDIAAHELETPASAPRHGNAAGRQPAKLSSCGGRVHGLLHGYLRAVQQEDSVLPGGRGKLRSKSSAGASQELRSHPLLEALAPALRHERALSIVVIIGPPEGANDPEVQGLRELASLLCAHGCSGAMPARRLETTSVREGFARGPGSRPELIESFGMFAGSFNDLRSPQSSPMRALLRGEVAVGVCGFPDTRLPALTPYMARFVVTASDRRRMAEAAETEMHEFEALGWVTSAPAAGSSNPHVPSRLYVSLADCYVMPDEQLSVTTVRSFARGQDQTDPLVRTIRRLREDVALAVALLPLCAVHPFNVVRLLRLGGVHTLLNLLSDASALAPGHGQAAPAVDQLSTAEIAALVLTVLCAFAPVRRFLVNLGNVLELLSVAIQHPASDRQLPIFSGLLARLCWETNHRQVAAEVVSAALADQIPRLLGRSGNTALAEALLAATAQLSPFIPCTAFVPVLQPLLGHLSASAPPAFQHFVCGLCCSMRRSSDLPDLSSLVPRILSLVPLGPPATASFHGGAAALLALCSHTAATTSLSRRWIASTAMALVRQSLRSGPEGLAAVSVCVPLAAAPGAEQFGSAPASQTNEWYSEVEENVSLQATLRWTRSAGGLAAAIADSSTPSQGTLHGMGTFEATASRSGLPRTPAPPLRKQQLHGRVQLWNSKEMAESPNSVLFHQRPQLRIIVHDQRAEVLLSVALLPATSCFPPLAACGCACADEADTSHPSGCGGQLGLWLCELPTSLLGSPLDLARGRRHQLDLRPPIHASAAQPGQSEHLVSVTLPRGLYTLIPFSSHDASLGAEAVSNLRDRCRAQGCGCVDLNLVQPMAWDRSARYVSVGAWAECANMEIFEPLPYHQRFLVSGELLAQSIPIWLCVPEGCGTVEVLICVSSAGEAAQDADPTALKGTEPCLDLWPPVQHRRVRNERTGALRINVPELVAGEPVRLSCLWQESVDPSRWQRGGPQLLIYASGHLQLFTPPPCPRSPSLGMLAAGCGAPRAQKGRWQAAMLLAGGWTPGFSSGFGSLRNPQVVIETPWSPGRGEELQLNLYLSIPREPQQGKVLEHSRKRPSCALTVFLRQESKSFGEDGPERLLEGVLRRELGASKAAIGGYVTAQLVLSGAEARQPLYVVLQNSAPQETHPWQLRVLARIRPAREAVAVASTPATTSIAEQVCPASADENVDARDTGVTDVAKPCETPDVPPITCAILGGITDANHIYACWPDALTLYVPKPSRGDPPPAGSQERVVAWVPKRQPWCDRELLRIDGTLGIAPHGPVARGGPEPWPAHEAFLEEQEESAEVRATIDPALMLAKPPRVPVAATGAPIRARVVADVGENRGVAELTPVRPSPDAVTKEETKDAAVMGASPSPMVPVPPSAVPDGRLANRAHGVRSAIRGASEPRQWQHQQQHHQQQQSPPQSQSAMTAAALGGNVVTSTGGVHSERHARVEALLRRRRHGRDVGAEQGYGYGSDSPRGAHCSQASSVPPSRRRGGGGDGVAEADAADNWSNRRKLGGGSDAPGEVDDMAGGPSAGFSLPPPGPGIPRIGGAGSPAQKPGTPRRGGSVEPRTPRRSGSIEPTARRGSSPSPRLPPVATAVTSCNAAVSNSSALDGTSSAADGPPSAGRADGAGGEFGCSASPPAPRSNGDKCCPFAGHPALCCRSDPRISVPGQAPLKHIVRLERHAGSDRLGFGNVAAGPRDAPVLVVSWIREGALLAAYNNSVPEGRRVPPQSAIVAVNGVAGDVLRMREQLRAEVVEMEVVAPDRWKWGKVVQASA